MKVRKTKKLLKKLASKPNVSIMLGDRGNKLGRSTIYDDDIVRVVGKKVSTSFPYDSANITDITYIKIVNISL